MSVIRQPEVLGRTTQRRLVGVTAALSATAVESLAVGLWFLLVVDARSATTALAALGILFCGALLRTGVFGVAIDEFRDLLEPPRLAATLLLTGGWVLWLWVAELIGGGPGLIVATALLGGLLAVQFAVEHAVFCRRRDLQVLGSIVPALLLAAGSAAMLVSAWFVEWSVTTPELSLGVTTVFFWIDAVHVGLVAFAVCSFLAHQRRFQCALRG